MPFSYTSPAGYHLKLRLSVMSWLEPASVLKGGSLGPLTSTGLPGAKRRLLACHTALLLREWARAPGYDRLEAVRETGRAQRRRFVVTAVDFKQLRCMRRWLVACWGQWAQFRWKQRQHGCISKGEMRFESFLNSSEMMGSRWPLLWSCLGNHIFCLCILWQFPFCALIQVWGHFTLCAPI